MWIDDPETGTRARLGLVGAELAQEFYRQGNARLGREALREPLVGFWFSKQF